MHAGLLVTYMQSGSRISKFFLEQLVPNLQLGIIGTNFQRAIIISTVVDTSVERV